MGIRVRFQFKTLDKGGINLGWLNCYFHFNSIEARKSGMKINWVIWLNQDKNLNGMTIDRIGSRVTTVEMSQNTT